MYRVDLNSDLGESFGRYTLGSDDQIIPLITRPKDYSFPSGHTCASFAVALVCLRMLPGKWGILPVVLAGMIAFSRLYLGVHYPGDVLAGFLVALLTSTVACRLMRRTFSPQKS